MKLPKTSFDDKTHKNEANTLYLDIWSILLSGQVLHSTSLIEAQNSSHLFWNLEKTLC